MFIDGLIAVDSATGQNVSFLAPAPSVAPAWTGALNTIANTWAGVQTAKIAAKSQNAPSIYAPGLPQKPGTNNNLLIYGGIALAAVVLIMIASKK